MVESDTISDIGLFTVPSLCGDINKIGLVIRLNSRDY